MPEPIEGLYFNWLRAKVVDPTWPQYMYLDLLKILYRTEFVWTIIGDKNREEDGLELRIYFLNETRLEQDPDWQHEPCSILEVLIAFANRASFQTDIPTSEWFWHFLRNLGLEQYRTISDEDLPLIERILNTFVWRIYDPSGYGGLFPLREPLGDQTTVEIWYQFCAYTEEQGLLY